MRIALIAFGSRGDVEPYIALGQGLQRAGHEVRLVTNETFAGLAAAHGLPVSAVPGDVQGVAQSEEMRELLAKGNFLAITRETARHAQGAAVQWAEASLEACGDRELLVAGVGGLFVAAALAEKLGIPLLQAYVQPFTPTKAFASVLLPGAVPPLGGAFNRLTHHLTRQVMWQGFRSADRKMREEALGMPAAPFGGPFGSAPFDGAPVLYGFSPAVVPRPADWDDKTVITGYWFLDAAEGWSPPAGLEAFLAAGPPPVYAGFGSMAARDPEATTRLVVEALAQSGQRGILSSGWAGLHKEGLPETVYPVDAVPHAWLFPRVAAVVHHGGAGTTAAGLRAGVPSILTPFFADQFFWGARVAALGVGPEAIKQKELTAERLAAAIRTAVGDETMRRRAAALGETIRAEDGPATAAAAVERYFDTDL